MRRDSVRRDDGICFGAFRESDAVSPRSHKKLVAKDVCQKRLTAAADGW